jgi:hypothetical protein
VADFMNFLRFFVCDCRTWQQIIAPLSPGSDHGKWIALHHEAKSKSFLAVDKMVHLSQKRKNKKRKEEKNKL